MNDPVTTTSSISASSSARAENGSAIDAMTPTLTIFLSDTNPLTSSPIFSIFLLRSQSKVDAWGATYHKIFQIEGFVYQIVASLVEKRNFAPTWCGLFALLHRIRESVEATAPIALVWKEK
jgi:hypothetical protein